MNQDKVDCTPLQNSESTIQIAPSKNWIHVNQIYGLKGNPKLFQVQIVFPFQYQEVFVFWAPETCMVRICILTQKTIFGIVSPPAK